jgi:hypothetical protein
MKPNTMITRGGSRSQRRRHREVSFGKRHIALAVALLGSFAASAPAQTGEEPASPSTLFFPCEPGWW